MSKAIGIFFILLCLSSCDSKNDFAEPVKNYFLKYYGKEGLHNAADFIINNDGTFLILGTSEVIVTKGTNLGRQIYVAKVDAAGNVMWEYSYGGVNDEVAKDIELTASGELLVLANEFVTPLDQDIKLFLLNPNGATKPMDSVTYGIDPGLSDYAISVTELTSGFLVCGSKDTKSSDAPDIQDDIHVLFTKDLTVVPDATFSQVYGPGNFDVAVKAYPYQSSIFIFGYTNAVNPGDPNQSFNYWIYKVNSFGVSQNELRIGSPLDDEKVCTVSLSPPASGDGFLLTGAAKTSANVNNPYFLKLNKDLTFTLTDVQFQSRLTDDLGDLGTNLEKISSYASISSGYLVLATQKKPNGSADLYLTKIDNRGQLLWSEPVILGGAGDDFAATVSELPDGHIMVNGTMTVGGPTGQQKIVLMKLNSSGKLSN